MRALWATPVVLLPLLLQGQDAPAAPDSAGAKVYEAFEVDQPAALAPQSFIAPRYPDMLRAQCVSGEVQAQFVVDATGAVNLDTFKVLNTPHEHFARSVRQALATARYLPARLDGRRVPQVVQQAFGFAVTAKSCNKVRKDG